MNRQQASILIVDDHPIFIDALRLALRPIIDRPAVSSASSLAVACAMLATQKVDLILLDLMLPDAGGVESVSRIRDIAAGARIVVISGRDDAVTVNLARALGAHGFISKGDPLTSIQSRLLDIVAGKLVYPDNDKSDLADAISLLTPAQARVLAAATTGKLNKQIAFEMNLAEPTVKSHLSAIFKRLGVTNRTQAILAVSGR